MKMVFFEKNKNWQYHEITIQKELALLCAPFFFSLAKNCTYTNCLSSYAHYPISQAWPTDAAIVGQLKNMRPFLSSSKLKYVHMMVLFVAQTKRGSPLYSGAPAIETNDLQIATKEKEKRERGIYNLRYCFQSAPNE